MNKILKFISFLLIVVLISLTAGFAGSILLLTSKKLNLPVFGPFDIEKFIPQKNIIIEKTEQVNVDNDTRLQNVYKNTQDGMVYVALQNVNNIYTKENIINQGFVFTSDGWIFTNNQSLFDKTKKYVVVLNDGKYYNVQTVLFDKYDFVLLKIDNEKMLVSSLGSYNDINIGSLVFANNGYSGISIDYIKNKFNGELTLLNNNINNVCLFDLSGKIVGVVGATETSQKNKYGVLVPVKTKTVFSPEYLKNVIYSINIKSDYIIRPNISGLVLNTYGDILGSDEKIENGVSIKSVGAVNNYGFLAGDLITEINSVPVNGNLDFMLQNYKVGDKIKFMLIRDGKEISNTVTLQ